MKLKTGNGAHAAPRQKKAPAEKTRAETKPKKKNRRGGKISVVICCLLAAVIALAGAYMLWERQPERHGGGLSTPEPTENGEAPGVEPTGAPPEESPAQPTPVQAEEGVFTFLLVGMDKVGANTDTMMVGRFDTVRHTVNVVSIPRDTLVNVPGSVKKVNTLYAVGGIDRLKSGLRDLMGFEVDFYAVVDLNAFVELVDAIGGVDYNVPIDMYYYDPAQGLYIDIKAGQQHLNGEDALKVVRFRSGYASADIGRIGTQQDFLKSVISQMLKLGNIPNLPEFIEIFERNVETDLTSANISYLARQLLSCKSEDINFYTLPGNYADSMWLLLRLAVSGRVAGYGERVPEPLPRGCDGGKRQHPHARERRVLLHRRLRRGRGGLLPHDGGISGVHRRVVRQLGGAGAGADRRGRAGAGASRGARSRAGGAVRRRGLFPLTGRTLSDIIGVVVVYEKNPHYMLVMRSECSAVCDGGTPGLG